MSSLCEVCVESASIAGFTMSLTLIHPIDLAALSFSLVKLFEASLSEGSAITSPSSKLSFESARLVVREF